MSAVRGSTPRLHVAVLGAARTGRSRLVRDLNAASPQLLALEAEPAQLGPADLPAFDLVLLTGLDLPASNPIAAEQAEQAGQDLAIRQALQAAGHAWRVVYGAGAERTQNALQAVAEVAPWAWSGRLSEAEAGRWQRLQATCDTCGDAACEHRLFTRHLAT